MRTTIYVVSWLSRENDGNVTSGVYNTSFQSKPQAIAYMLGCADAEIKEWKENYGNEFVKFEEADGMSLRAEEKLFRIKVEETEMVCE